MKEWKTSLYYFSISYFSFFTLFMNYFGMKIHQYLSINVCWTNELMNSWLSWINTKALWILLDKHYFPSLNQKPIILSPKGNLPKFLRSSISQTWNIFKTKQVFLFKFCIEVFIISWHEVETTYLLKILSFYDLLQTWWRQSVKSLLLLWLNAKIPLVVLCDLCMAISVSHVRQ